MSNTKLGVCVYVCLCAFSEARGMEVNSYSRSIMQTTWLGLCGMFRRLQYIKIYARSICPYEAAGNV